MHTKITSALKVSALALVLSFGLSYVYAWTAPTVSAPGGNVAAPINTSAVSQTKAGDIAVNNATHFLDTGTTIPETPGGGNGAVALNGWPNYSDVAANAVKLAGLTSADILSAQTAGGGASAVQPSMMTFWSGSASCPTNWTKAFSGKISRMYYVGTNPFIVGVTDTNPVVSTGSATSNNGVYFTCVDSATTGIVGNMDAASSGTSCTVCAR